MSCSTSTTAAPLGRIFGSAGIDVADDHRGEAEADLVAEQKLGVRHQRAADRHHLLLAAGERACPEAFGAARGGPGTGRRRQPRLHGPAARRAPAADQQGSPPR